MAKRPPRWQQFETVIAEIQKQLASQADVKHNHKVQGKSGRLRQLDVTVTQIIGIVPVMVVYECKYYTRAVGIEKVEAFVQKLFDVGASNGVMVSAQGFDAGAQAIAERNNVLLLTCREAEEADWRSVVGPDAWLTFTAFQYRYQEARLELEGDEAPKTISADDTIYVESEIDQHEFIAVGTVKSTVMEPLLADLSIGLWEGDCIPERRVYMCIDGDWMQIKLFIFKILISAKAYPLNLKIAEGKVLENATTGNAKVIQAASEGFDWAEVIQNHPGVDLTPDTFRQIRDTSPLRFPAIDLSSTQQFLRVVLTHKNG